jgi:hypothetical protein
LNNPLLGASGFSRNSYEGIKMRKTKTISVLSLVLALAPGASACGDKLLHLNRIHRPHQSSVAASVILFSRSSSVLERAASLRLATAFQESGYKLTVLQNESELMAAIQAGTADILIMDMPDTSLMKNFNAKNFPFVIPVIEKNDRQAMAQGKQYDVIIKSPAKAAKFVDAVDHALDTGLIRSASKANRQSIFAR